MGKRYVVVYDSVGQGRDSRVGKLEKHLAEQIKERTGPAQNEKG